MRKLLFIFSIIIFTACDDDSLDNSSQIAIDNKMLEGEWVSINSSKTYYTDIVLSGSSWAQFTVVRNDIGNNSVVETDEGVWTWYDDSNSLAITTQRRKLPTYQVMELSNDNVIMHNSKYNTIETYYRVVESIDLYPGNTAQIKYLSEHSDLSVDQISSSNQDVATVSNDGVVDALQGGVSFIQIKSGQKDLYVKITVTSRFDRYSEQTKMLIDDIIELYGEPDEFDYADISAFSSVNKIGGCIVYFKPNSDNDLEELAYTYDLDSHIIYQIGTLYKTQKEFDPDFSFIQSFYYAVLEPEISNDVFYEYYYGKDKTMYKNAFLMFINFFKFEDIKYKPFISYINIDF